jgi:L-alanine-DL-glutamate epimerase-like enolase superfamily enzyme
MPALTSIRAIAVSVPIEKPTRMSTRVLGQRDYVIVEVEEAGSNAVGLGYSYAGTGGGRVLALAVRDLLAATAIGADAEDILGLYERLYQETLLSGRRGIVIRALAALDIALWDLAGKRASLPLAVLLGGGVRPVPAYASGGYYVGDERDAEQTVRTEIAHNEALGFSDHKIKVGGLSIEADARRVRAALEPIRPGGRLALDANNAYPNAHEALRAIRAFEEAAGATGLWWVEEPLSPDDIAGHAELARTIETPIATGEIAQTRHEFRALIEAGAADILQPDVGVLGGISEWIRIARTAETFRIPVAPHWHANAHVQLAAATPNCLTVEHFELDKDIYNFERLLTPESRLEARDGTVVCPNRPGLGIEFDQSAVAKYRLED